MLVPGFSCEAPGNPTFPQSHAYDEPHKPDASSYTPKIQQQSQVVAGANTLQTRAISCKASFLQQDL